MNTYNEIIDIRFSDRTPKKVIIRTIENENKFGMSLHDSFEEAARYYCKPNTELWAAWYYSDFRKFIPYAYKEEFLNFKKHPLRYIKRNGKYEERKVA